VDLRRAALHGRAHAQRPVPLRQARREEPRGFTLRTTYTFAPRLTLQGYAQLFLASGHYTDFTQYQSDPTGPRPAIRSRPHAVQPGPIPSNPDFEQGVLNVNVVLRWEYMLGSTLYPRLHALAGARRRRSIPDDVGTLNLARSARRRRPT
jgi:hypothetical protein